VQICQPPMKAEQRFVVRGTYFGKFCLATTWLNFDTRQIMSIAMIITTKRFLLRDFTEDDGSAFLAYHADPGRLRFTDQTRRRQVTPSLCCKRLRFGPPSGPGATFSWQWFSARSRRPWLAAVGCAARALMNIGRCEFNTELRSDSDPNTPPSRLRVP